MRPCLSTEYQGWPYRLKVFWARRNVFSTIVLLAQDNIFTQSSAVSRWVRVVRHHETGQCLLLLSVSGPNLWTAPRPLCALFLGHH